MHCQNPTTTTSRKATERMPEDRGGDITQHLLAWRDGDSKAIERRDWRSRTRTWLKKALTTWAGP